MIEIRKGQVPPPLERAPFSARFRASFTDPAFRSEDPAINRLEDIARVAYTESRKAPVTQKAGAGYADPTSTSGKKVAQAKALELEGWDYPQHLGGQAYGLVIHGDVAGLAMFSLARFAMLRRTAITWMSWSATSATWRS
jgi:hypothetical protein